MYDCNCSLIIEKGPFVEWMATVGGKLTLYLWKQWQLQVLISKKDSILENTWTLQVASWNNGGTTQMYGCMCFFEVTRRLKYKYLLNTLYIHNHGCKCCSEKNTVAVKEWMAATNFV